MASNKGDINDFSKSLDLIIRLLFKGAKKASFRLGFGILALGLARLALTKFDVSQLNQILIGLGVFFISARIGEYLDELLDKAV